MTDNIDVLVRKAAVLTVLSVMLRDLPKREWLDPMVKERLFESLPYAREQQASKRGVEVLNMWMKSYDDASFDVAYNDYMKLFGAIGRPLASPWESNYAKDGAGLIFQKETLEVRKWYREFDMQIEKLHHEPDDHIAYELEFLAKLAEMEFAARELGDIAEGDRLANAQTQFADEHLLGWVFDWADLVETNAKSDLYVGVAALVRGVCEELRG